MVPIVPAPSILSEDELRNLLRHEMAAAGGMAKWARSHGFKHAEVSLFMSGDRPAGKRTLAALGYRCETTHRYIKEAQDGQQDRDGSRQTAASEVC